MRNFMIIAFCASFNVIAAHSQHDSSSTAVAQASDTAQIDLHRFAASIVKDAPTGFERAELLLTWLGQNFKWLSTDYKQRTVKEIIARQGGNCFELASVYMALVKTLGINYRQVAEINVHPHSERRQLSAERLVKERGPAYSVFGEQHNDHRWVEIFDERSGEWIPADPSVGVIGLEAWLKSRVWFGERTAIDTSITNQMIVPFAIFITDAKRAIVEDRTEHYLVTSFDRLYGGALSKLKSWNEWRTGLAKIGDRCKGAFEGRTNLHNHRNDISGIATVYARLRSEFEQSGGKQDAGQTSR